jgi:hypothetical protein
MLKGRPKMRRGMRWFEIGADVLQTFARHEDPVVVEPHPESAALTRNMVELPRAFWAGITFFHAAIGAS